MFLTNPITSLFHLHTYKKKTTYIISFISFLIDRRCLRLSSPCECAYASFFPRVYIITLKARLVCFSSTACASVCNPICRNEKITNSDGNALVLLYLFSSPLRDKFLKSSILHFKFKNFGSYTEEAAVDNFFFNEIWFSYHNNTKED